MAQASLSNRIIQSRT